VTSRGVGVGLTLALGVVGCARGPDVVIVGASPAAILAAGATSEGCEPGRYFFFHGSDRVPVQNFVPDTQCTSEIGVFRANRALAVMSPEWTPEAGDAISVPSEPARVQQILVRIIPVRNESEKEVRQTPRRIEADVCRAHHVLNTMQCGVVVNVTLVPRRTEESSGLAFAGCDYVEALKQTYGFTPGALNVYYTAGNEDKGEWCGPSNDVLLVSRALADNETLAHEIGHAFALGHFDGDPTNVMFSGDPHRTRLALGQCFRANLDPRSLGGRGRAPRDCSAASGSKTCPAEWWPSEAGATRHSEISAVQQWLEAEETTKAQLDALLALGDRAIQSLRDERRQLYDSVKDHLVATYAQLKTYSGAHPDVPLSLTEAEYVTIYLGSAEARWEVRAAIALFALSSRSDEARKALQELIATARPETLRILDALAVR
jgi:hypothetical protein